MAVSIGDKVKYIESNGLCYGGTIVSYNPTSLIFTVRPDVSFTVAFHYKYLSQLSLISSCANPPVIYEYLSYDVLTQKVMDSLETLNTPILSNNDTQSIIETECDCGGLKTYKTMSTEAHSNWCKSRNNT